MKKINLGCGPHFNDPSFVKVDSRKSKNIDVVHDLNKYPLPFPDNEFDWIEMSHILEHIEKPLMIMNEVHRISKNDGTVRIITPHYSSQLSYGDLEHFHHFGYITFSTLQNTKLFKIKKHKLWFTDIYKIFGISLLANWFPRRWEKYLAFIFPALYVEVFLEVIKNENIKNDLVDQYMY